MTSWSQPRLTPTTTQRGYGAPHKRTRLAYKARLDAGETFPCPKCGHPVTASMDWHLDHTNDRTTYLGPAHARCNTSAGGRKARARAKAQQRLARW